MPNFDDGLNDNKNLYPIADTTEKISDEELMRLIGDALRDHREEDIIWITSELIRFKRNPENWKKIDVQTIKDIRHFSDFNDFKKTLPISLRKLKSKKDLIKFLEIIKTSEIELPNLIIELKKEKRICLFLLNYLKNNNTFNFTYEENAYMHLIHWYFTKRENTERRLEKIETALNTFNKNIKINEKNHFKKLENQKFLEWLLPYLRKTDDYFMNIPFIETNHKRSQFFITAYLDYYLYIDKEKYENTLNKINKAWSQKKFRDGNKVKKPYHIPLTKKAKEELAKLSDFKNLSESDILEKLIHQMFLNEMCDEKENSKY